MKEKNRRILGGSLLALFTAYILMVVSYTHIHFIDGRLVVESHPDLWGDNHSTVPVHPVNGAAFFHQSQTLASIVSDIKPVQVPLLSKQWSIFIYTIYVAPVVALFTTKHCPLRAPPALYNIW